MSSPSPKKWGGRFGSVLRRSSSILKKESNSDHPETLRRAPTDTSVPSDEVFWTTAKDISALPLSSGHAKDTSTPPPAMEDSGIIVVAGYHDEHEEQQTEEKEMKPIDPAPPTAVLDEPITTSLPQGPTSDEDQPVFDTQSIHPSGSSTDLTGHLDESAERALSLPAEDSKPLVTQTSQRAGEPIVIPPWVETRKEGVYAADDLPEPTVVIEEDTEREERAPVILPTVRTASVVTNDAHLKTPSSLFSPSFSHSPMQRHLSFSAELGWAEHVLPDATSYFVHPTLRVTSDVDPRAERVASLSMEELWTDGQGHSLSVPDETRREIWLKGEMASQRFERLLVDHQTMTALPQSTSDSKNESDAHQRYWQFVESHPAHCKISPLAKREAFEALDWAWTDQLLPSGRPHASPFTAEECQELRSLVKSLPVKDDQGNIDHGLENRLVARIHLRLIRCRDLQTSPSEPPSRGWPKIFPSFPATILRVIRTFSPQGPPRQAGHRSWTLPFFNQYSTRSVRLSLAGVAIVTLGLCAFVANDISWDSRLDAYLPFLRLGLRFCAIWSWRSGAWADMYLPTQ